MNRFLPQLLSLHFYCYVQKLLFFVCHFPSCYSVESICQIWLFWRNLHTFMVFSAFVCVYDVCAYVYSCSRVWESVCIHIRAQVGVRCLPQLPSTSYTEACPPSFTWVLGTWPLVLVPSAISPSTRSHLSSPTLGSVICNIISSISRNNVHLKISFMF